MLPCNSDNSRLLIGPKTHLLCDCLKATIVLLERVAADHWAAWMKVSLSQIVNGDLSGVKHVLAAYGGMGSFNDLVLCSGNGHRVTNDEYRTVNDELDMLRNEAYDLAQFISRNAVVE